MKLLISYLILAASLFAQEKPKPDVPASVSGSIVVTAQDGTARTYTISLPATAIQAMAQFIADTTVVNTVINADGTATTTYSPKYSDIGELVVRHIAESLIAVLIQRYPPPTVQSAAQSAAAAQEALQQATAQASQGTVTVK